MTLGFPGVLDLLAAPFSRHLPLFMLFHSGGVVLLTPANLIWFQESDSEWVGAWGQSSSEKMPGKQAQLSTHY